jgi:hypothetical protein
MKRILAILLSMAILISLFIPSVVLAVDPTMNPDNLLYAPPELDEQQSTRWMNATPLSRGYLARMWGIDKREALLFGAVYDPRGYDAGAYSGGTIRWNNNGVIESKQLMPDYTAGRWNIPFKYIEQFVPILVEYPSLSFESKPFIVDYDAPPNLDRMQQVRWGQSLPTTRPYLAELYGVSKHDAIKYGAKY